MYQPFVVKAHLLRKGVPCIHRVLPTSQKREVPWMNSKLGKRGEIKSFQNRQLTVGH